MTALREDETARDRGANLVQAEDLEVYFPIRAGFLQTMVGMVEPSTASRSRSAAARRSAWSASPAAARARPGGRSSGSAN